MASEGAKALVGVFIHPEVMASTVVTIVVILYYAW